MKRSWFVPLVPILCLGVLIACQPKPKDQLSAAQELEAAWQADWITAADRLPDKNAWIAFRKTFELTDHTGPYTLRLAVDSKYWLYLNGELEVLEGGLKRGPTPNDTYYDQVDLTGKLKPGQNTIALLQWYFGKESFSHKSSGQPGLIAELYRGQALVLSTDTSWKAIPHPAYLPESADPQPNWRLPESNIVFDAQLDLPGWTRHDFEDGEWPQARSLGSGITAPWNRLVKRPIPFWKDYGLKNYENPLSLPFTSQGDTIKAKLPYNAQITPYFKVKASAGQRIIMLTDHYKGGSEYNMRAEYLTKAGEQAYESKGWINGHEVYYVIPKGVEVLDLKYRETGYAAEFAGSFTCDDPFYNQLWQKALRTLYVTLRDNYMDCPDRERAQWWGDVVLESGEAFYALDRQSDQLTRKGILELMHWQRPDSTIYSPVPAGNWNQELPGQMLASVGYYGFYNYYLHTGDLETIKEVYEPVKRYLALWKLKEDGTVIPRKGGWTWGDWGQNKDVPLLMNTQYYLALKGFLKMSEALGKSEEATEARQNMDTFKENFNKAFWRGDHYRSEDYKGLTDDRSQGLAVVAGLADHDKHEYLFKVLQAQRHASPYMEKYILEALFQMGQADFALERMQERFAKMVNHPTISTLWEGWGIGKEGFGGGTTNHAWSGGGLTLLSQYVAGIAPTAPGYTAFQVKPQPGFLRNVEANVPTVKGDIRVVLKQEEDYQLEVEVPVGSEASVHIPDAYVDLELNGETVTSGSTDGYFVIKVKEGTHRFTAKTR